MVKKYTRVLEQREINSKTGSTWALPDVPTSWRSRTEAQVIADHYYFLEDGTAMPVPPNEE